MRWHANGLSEYVNDLATMVERLFEKAEDYLQKDNVGMRLHQLGAQDRGHAGDAEKDPSGCGRPESGRVRQLQLFSSRA